MRVVPSPPALTCALPALDCEGSACRMSPSEARPEAARSAWVTTETGARPVNSSCSIEVSVTEMTSVLPSSSDGAAGLAGGFPGAEGAGVAGGSPGDGTGASSGALSGGTCATRRPGGTGFDPERAGARMRNDLGA
jgi:hypothetical protein